MHHDNESYDSGLTDTPVEQDSPNTSRFQRDNTVIIVGDNVVYVLSDYRFDYRTFKFELPEYSSDPNCVGKIKCLNNIPFHPNIKTDGSVVLGDLCKNFEKLSTPEQAIGLRNLVYDVSFCNYPRNSFAMTLLNDDLEQFILKHRQLKQGEYTPFGEINFIIKKK